MPPSSPSNRRRPRIRARRRRAPLLLTVALVAGLTAAVAGPPAAQPAASAAPAGPLERSDEASARALARQVGRQVEVASLRTETDQVLANPDGTSTLVQHVLPVRVRRGGTWRAVDTTLERRADGTIAPRAISVDLALSGGGDTTLLRMAWHGRQMELDWPAPLPAPVLDGDVATYPEVMPGVDLKIRADVLGYSQVLEVKTREAARNPALAALRFPLRTTGLAKKLDATGNLNLLDERGNGSVFFVPAPTMWDSPGGPVDRRAIIAGPPVGAKERRMRLAMREQERGRAHLDISPDLGMLADPATRFPVYLDPAAHISPTRTAWTYVSWRFSGSHWNEGGEARVGYHDTDAYGNLYDWARSFFRFDVSALRGKGIISAVLNAYETWSWSCTKSTVELWHAGPIGSSTTWSNQPSWYSEITSKVEAKGHDANCPAGGVDFNATSFIQRMADQNVSAVTLALRTAQWNEDNRNTQSWKKFRNNPKLEVTYNTRPDVPSKLSMETGLPCVTGANRPVISNLQPKLNATATDADPGNLIGVRFQVWVPGDASPLHTFPMTTKVTTGSPHTVTVPPGKLVDGGNYAWWVHAEDDSGHAATNSSAWSGWCEFAVDTTPPAHPPVVSSTVYPETKPDDPTIRYGGGVGVPGTFTFAPGGGDTGITGYLWDVNSHPPTTPVTASGPGQTATVTVTPTADGLLTLHVRSKDAAGNLGEVYSYQFYVRPVTFPAGYWQLDEGSGTTAADASGSGYTATLLGGATWGPGRIEGGLSLDGTDDHVSTSAPVVQTDGSFTVAAWVRLTGTFRHYVAASQDGSRNSGFVLQYDGGADRWSMEMATTDNDSESYHHALSSAPPRYNVWTHLAGVYDKAAGQLRLYVNGQLDGTAAHTSTWRATGALKLGRGLWHGIPGNYWSGGIDDVRVHQGVLPADTIAQLARPPAKLVGHWKLDEGTGTTTADASGHGTTLTLAPGSSWTDFGWIDRALALDGVSGNAYSQFVPVVPTDQSFSVAAWVRLTAKGGHRTAVCQEGALNCGFLLQYVWDADRWSMSMPTTDTVNESYVRALSVESPREDMWTHLVGVYDATAGQVRIYVDGLLHALVNHSTAWHASGSLVLGRGKWHGALGEYWPGDLDDVRVYQGPLSDEEIFALATT